MMDNLRAAANHVVLKIILAIVAISFVLTGVGNYLIGGGGDYAAKINGQVISRTQLEQAVQNERSRQQESLGDSFSALAANEGYMLQMRRQVLSQLIDETLLDQYAQTLGLAVSDGQIKDAIFAIPSFRTDNHFDNEKYRSIVNSMGLTTDQYAQLMRKQLLTQQLIQGLGGTGFLLPSETDRLLSLAIQERHARLATIDIDSLLAKQTASDAEIQNYYNQNKNSYVLPESFKASYIAMDAASMQGKITVGEPEIQAYYDQHKDQFTVPGRKRYSIIQTKTEADAKAILAELQAGADFATVAKQRSTDVISAKNGGDIGWMTADATVDELKQANLNNKGQLSGVITSSIGYIVARLTDIQPDQVKPLADVHAVVAAKVKQEKAVDAYYAMQQKVSDAASNDNESLAAAEAAAGTKAVQSGWFTRDNVPEALNFDPVKQALFGGSLLGANGAPGNNSDVITVDGDRAFILRLADHKPESIKPLDTVRPEVELRVKRQKAIQQARMDAEKMLVALKEGKGDEAMKAAGLTFGAVQTFDSTRQNDPLTQMIFTLPQPQPNASSYGTSADSKGNIVLVALDSVVPRKIGDQQRAQVVSQLIQGMTGVTFDALLNNLRAEAKIKMGTGAQMQ